MNRPRRAARTLVVLSVLLTAFLFQAREVSAAFAVQGIVSGRIYDELATDQSIWDEFHNIGIGWIRIEFEEFFNMPPGTDWNHPTVQARKAEYQQLIQNAHARGILVLGACSYNSMPYHSSFPDTDASLQHYVNAVNWHLLNYNVNAIEVWNEPHANNFGGKLQRYSKMLVMTYDQLKGTHSSVQFVGPATANAERGTWLGFHGTNGDQIDYENSIFNCWTMRHYRANHGGNLPLDKLSFHTYGTGGDPNGNFYFDKTFDEYWTTIDGYRDRNGRDILGAAPVWITEYGWDDRIVGAENHRTYHETMVVKLYNKPEVEVPFKYSYRDDEDEWGTEFKEYGILKNSDHGFVRKRVYYPFVSHISIVGLFSQDGVNEWTVDQIIDKYMEYGRDAVGSPWRHPYAPWYGDKAHYWGPDNNGVIQQFNGGAYGECGILMRWSIGTAYLLKGGFYQTYVANGGPYSYGWPTSDEYWEAGFVRQNFEAGQMRWSSGSGVTWHPW